ncbi:unnamed protein product [Prunus armeniaca]|uniref:Protein kinase domain-containing protein n=1 Tax=Prunus armeniaca TaxID=36596 RepID=A0A6J5U7E5_PRUAR|nr:unnamed protein product [Prunus armeniaca]
MKLGASLPAYRTFALEELQEATHNFDDSTLLGEGSHGQIYRGKLPDGTFVAIRGLKMRKRQSPQVYTHLLEQISKLRHSHLVSALGHCLECHPDDSGVSRVFLIHAIQVAMEKGPPGRKLTWPQRIIAAIGVAKGIQFLHTGIVPGVKSNNLRIKNVLLDHDLHVKISSYNLPLLAENRGTMGTTVSSPAPKGSVQASWSCTKSEEYNHEMVECFNNGFKMFRDYASVSPDYNWSEIDVAGVWEVLNMGAKGMAHHSLVHATRRKDKDMDLLMDL